MRNGLEQPRVGLPTRPPARPRQRPRLRRRSSMRICARLSCKAGCSPCCSSAVETIRAPREIRARLLDLARDQARGDLGPSCLSRARKFFRFLQPATPDQLARGPHGLIDGQGVHRAHCIARAGHQALEGRSCERIDRLAKLRRSGGLFRRGVRYESEAVPIGAFACDLAARAMLIPLPSIDRNAKSAGPRPPRRRRAAFRRERAVPRREVEASGRLAERAVCARDEFLPRLRGAVRDRPAPRGCATRPPCAKPSGRAGRAATHPLRPDPAGSGPRAFGERLGHDVAVERVPAAQFQHVGLARMAREGGAERAQSGDAVRHAAIGEAEPGSR